MEALKSAEARVAAATMASQTSHRQTWDLAGIDSNRSLCPKVTRSAIRSMTIPNPARNRMCSSAYPGPGQIPRARKESTMLPRPMRRPQARVDGAGPFQRAGAASEIQQMTAPNRRRLPVRIHPEASMPNEIRTSRAEIQTPLARRRWLAGCGR